MSVEHFDIKGRQLMVGHEVAFGLPGTHRMGLGTVIKIDQKTITVMRKELNWRKEVEDVTYVRDPRHCSRTVSFADDE